MINIPNPSQEPPATSKSPSQDLKDIDALCTFKIKIESQNLEVWEGDWIFDLGNTLSQNEEHVFINEMK